MWWEATKAKEEHDLFYFFGERVLRTEPRALHMLDTLPQSYSSSLDLFLKKNYAGYFISWKGQYQKQDPHSEDKTIMK